MSISANFMSQRSLIVVFFLFFILASTALFWENSRASNPAFGKNWWSLAFVEPEKKESLSFRVANYGPDADFTYRVLIEGRSVEEDGIRLLSSEVFDVIVSHEASAATVEVKRMSDGRIKTLFRK